jgi:hypothetical protein
MTPRKRTPQTWPNDFKPSVEMNNPHVRVGVIKTNQLNQRFEQFKRELLGGSKAMLIDAFDSIRTIKQLATDIEAEILAAGKPGG